MGNPKQWFAFREEGTGVENNDSNNNDVAQDIACIIDPNVCVCGGFDVSARRSNKAPTE